jgi:uncharacterized membrane protein YkvA (DUF1232 family)
MLEGLKQWARDLRRDIVALSLAARDPRVPWYAKALAAAVAAYALSPIDLIPDFVPVLGQIDDLVLVPIGIWLVVQMIPSAVMADLRERARDRPQSSSVAGLVLVLMLWAAVIAFVTYHFWTVSV